MSTELWVFVSSTIEDLKQERAAICKALEGKGRIIRSSDNPGFPVEPDTSSHNACLAVVRRCHIFALLIGTRFGGYYDDQGKSITWREYDEAFSRGLAPIVMVNNAVNDLCIKISKKRAALIRDQPGTTALSVREFDALLNKEFAAETGGMQNPAATQRFIDAVRKGHENNWKLDWDGDPQRAIDHINLNMAVQTAVSTEQRVLGKNLAGAREIALNAVSKIGTGVLALIEAVRDNRLELKDAMTAYLELAEELLEELLGFSGQDQYTLTIYKIAKKKINLHSRVPEGPVPERDKAWVLGRGYVGVAANQQDIYFSGDVRHGGEWICYSDQDPQIYENYVSVMAKSFYLDRKEARGVVVCLTSNRMDHFGSDAHAHRYTFNSVVNCLNILMLDGGKYEQIQSVAGSGV